jgi:acyl-CoA reductase-like NAD-dependent aldehyde dehydrogenase
MSTGRIIADRRIASDFVAKFAMKVASLPLGDPRKPEPVVLGSVIGVGAAEHCNALIDDALAKGAKLVCGGKAESTLMPATVLDHVTPAMRARHEGTFAPAKCIVRVDGVDAAVHCANANEYGLSAAVFGRDIARAERSPTHRVGHLPCQRTGRARRSTDTLRRRQGLGPGPLRWQGRHRRVHRAALGHGADGAAALSLLTAARRNRQ